MAQTRTSRSVRGGVLCALVVPLLALSCAKQAPPAGTPGTPATSGLPASRCHIPNDPGHVTLRRLNNVEYNNTVHDLLGDTTQPARFFPQDPIADGFDRNADALAASTLWSEDAFAAARSLVNATWSLEEGTTATDSAVPGDPRVTHIPRTLAGDAWNLSQMSTIMLDIHLDTPGPITVSASVYTTDPGASLEFVIDSILPGSWPLTGQPGETQVLTATATLQAGDHHIGITTGAGSMALRSLSWTVPKPQTPFAQAHLRICDPAATAGCVQQIIQTFGRKAWRRPLAADELSDLLALEQQSEQRHASDPPAVRVPAAVRDALTAILCASEFLYRVELDPAPDTCAPHPLEDHELATRLSYLLWSTTPDEELLRLADLHQLHEPAVYAAQISRMFHSPQIQAFVHNFAGQWLLIRNLDDDFFMAAIFQQFDDDIRREARAETEELFFTFLTEDRPFNDILTADFSFLNDDLAKYYGLPPPAQSVDSPPPGDSPLVRTTLSGGARGGLLTQASILAASSHSQRTSPPLRGAWVLDNLLCSSVSAPPQGVQAFTDPPQGQAVSVRQQLAAHVKNPSCAACHVEIDPVGLGLDNYNPVGLWRTVDDNGMPIDPSGTLPDGRSFKTPGDLERLLRDDPRLSTCLTQKFLAYALGRTLTDDDQPTLAALRQQFAQDGNRLGELLRYIPTSSAFTMRRGELP